MQIVTVAGYQEVGRLLADGLFAATQRTSEAAPAFFQCAFSYAHNLT